MSSKYKSVYVVGAHPGSLINFRGELIRSLVESGCEVTAMASGSKVKVAGFIPTERVKESVKEMGAEFKSYPVSRNGLNPFEDFKTFLSLFRTFRVCKPDIVIAYTIKPVLWGGIATMFTRNTRFYAIITGLGFAFAGEGVKKVILRKFVIALYRLSLAKADVVFFQNRDNLNSFVDFGILPRDKASLVNGSGVDLERFSLVPLPEKEVVFLLIARLLGDKGVREYCEAACIVKKKYPQAIFRLVGPPDTSPDGIDVGEIEKWHDDGIINYRGGVEDVRSEIALSSVFVLPSYHEGMPRTVLEAMSMGRPILTTDVPGCRETVIEGENGFLVPCKEVEPLVEKIGWFLENISLLTVMGNKSRSLAEEKYDVHKVNREILMEIGI